MNAPNCEPTDYIDFLVAAQKVFNCMEAARFQSSGPQVAAHDALTRLWAEAAAQVRLHGGLRSYSTTRRLTSSARARSIW